VAAFSHNGVLSAKAILSALSFQTNRFGELSITCMEALPFKLVANI
jgi:hypothetical protein